ncbi:hypothetical protein AB0N31_03905 [Streptomyces sp. NPDC051051]|uniref:hypothetical protein n=1 Tax=Streptomyces sp. NPDC051051 TaxID=3155666 RepID=UPI003419C075
MDPPAAATRAVRAVKAGLSSRHRRHPHERPPPSEPGPADFRWSRATVVPVTSLMADGARRHGTESVPRQVRERFARIRDGS